MPLSMFDSINVGEIPAGAGLVAGYVNGHWPTYLELVRRFPKAHVLGIAVSSSADAECLDVEQGDATVAVAPGWVKRQQARGVRKPVVYTSVSQARSLLDALAADGIRRSDIRLWTAHYTFRPHLCTSACGFGFQGIADATQYHDHAFGRNLDASLVSDGFFPAPPAPPKPAPKPRRLWPVPVPSWFWAWAEWRKAGCITLRPVDAPRTIPAWAWVRLAAL